MVEINLFQQVARDLLAPTGPFAALGPSIIRQVTYIRLPRANATLGTTYDPTAGTVVLSEVRATKSISCAFFRIQQRLVDNVHVLPTDRVAIMSLLDLRDAGIPDLDPIDLVHVQDRLLDDHGFIWHVAVNRQDAAAAAARPIVRLPVG